MLRSVYLGMSVCLCLLGMVYGEGQATEVGEGDARGIYEAVQKANTKRLPQFFSARLSSGVIQLQLKNLPKEMIEFGKNPKLHFYFKKNNSPRLILANVESFYRNFFSPYEEVLSRSGLFLGVDNRGGYKRFIRQFEIIALKSNIEGVEVKLREREGLPGDYATYFFDKQWSIYRVQFYEADLETAEVKFYYVNKNGYRLPKRMLIYLKGENSLLRGGGGAEDHLVIHFLEHSFKVPRDFDIGL